MVEVQLTVLSYDEIYVDALCFFYTKIFVRKMQEKEDVIRSIFGAVPFEKGAGVVYPLDFQEKE